MRNIASGKNKSFHRASSYKAFSLLELSIVILIASILITGALTFSSASSDQAKIEATRQKMEVIYKAIGNFVLKNGALPCPAPLNAIKSTTVTYGTAGNCTAVTGSVFQSTGASNLYYGMVPVKSLDLSLDFAEDGFGTKIGYVVNKNLTTAGVAGFGIATIANDQIGIDAVLASGTNNLTLEGAFLLISFGKNKSGGFNNNSSSQNTNPSSVNSPQELSNSPTGSSGSFDKWFAFSHDSNDLFDDIVFFKTRNQLVVDFNLFDDVFCPSTTTAQVLNIAPFNNTTNFSFNSARYGEIAASTTLCTAAGAGFNKGPTYPTRRCEALGVWGPVINNCLN